MRKAKMEIKENQDDKSHCETPIRQKEHDLHK